MTDSECPVCCEQFNKTVHFKVVCEYSDCAFSACKECVRTYILSTSVDPNCMKCHKAFTSEFMIHNLNRTFIVRDYKDHRKTMLLERAISQLPEAMPLAEFLCKVDKQKAIIKDTSNKLMTLAKILGGQREQLAVLEREHRGIPKEIKKFIMGCQQTGCRGFLSTQYKCGVCDTYTCSKCLCVKGLDEHVCVESNVLSANLIKAQTKPCPSCGERISKIDGCDQMWCVTCHTAFGWKTGQIEMGVVHNPHFFQYHRTAAAGAGPNAAQGLHQCGQQQMPGATLMQPCLLFLKQDSCAETRASSHILRFMYMFVVHVRHVTLPAARGGAERHSDTMYDRVVYIRGRMDKSQLADALYKSDQKRYRQQLILNVLEVYDSVGFETLLGILNAPTTTPIEYARLIESESKKIDALVLYCNQQWLKISSDHHITVPFIMRNPEEYGHYSFSQANLHKELTLQYGKHPTEEEVIQFCSR